MSNNKNRIKELRVLKKMTQQELSSKVGITQSYLGKLERGENSVDIELMRKISRALNIKSYELLPIEEQPEEVTPEEREMLRMVRKMAKPEISDNVHLQPQDDCTQHIKQPTPLPKSKEI